MKKLLILIFTALILIPRINAESIRKIDREALEKRQDICSKQDYKLYTNFFVTVIGNEIVKNILEQCVHIKQNPNTDSKRKIYDLENNLNFWKRELIDKVQLPRPLVLESIFKKSTITKDIKSVIQEYLNFRTQTANGLKFEPKPYEFNIYIIYLRNFYLQDEFKELLLDINNPMNSDQEIKQKLNEFKLKLNNLKESYTKEFMAASFVAFESRGINPNKKWYSTVTKQIIANPYLKDIHKSNIKILHSCLETKSDSKLYDYAGFFQDYDIPYDFNSSKDKSLNSYLKLFVNTYFDERIFGERLKFLTKQCLGK